MPYRAKWEDRAVCWEFFGEVTLDEVNQADDEMFSDPRFDRLRYYLWDGTRVERFVGSEKEVMYTVATNLGAAQTVKHIKGALVATLPSLRENITRYIDISRSAKSTWELRLFDNLEAARAWLAQER